MKGPPRMLNEPKKKNVWSTLCTVLLALLCLLLLFELWFNGQFTSICVFGSSMNDTLQNGDWVYTRSDVAFSRFDIVTVDVHDLYDEEGYRVFGSTDPSEPVDTIIKRVIGLEGDAIECREGVLYIRYAGTSEFVPFPDEPWAKGTCNSFPVREVGEGEVFLLGDNRGTSHDSSEADVGCLGADRVIGVVTEWSLEHKGAVTKWESFRNGLREKLQEFFFGKEGN